MAPADMTVVGLLDPFTRRRHDLRFEAWPGPSGKKAARELDGSNWWLLPAVVDADAHMPFIPTGFRNYDLLAALHGGVQHMVIALPYQLARQHQLVDLVAEAKRSVLPSVTPVISVSPDAESADFPSWLLGNLDVIEAHLPAVVKLYTGDPHFAANLDAVRSAGLTPAVFAFTSEDFRALTDCEQGPLHVRHATSRSMVEAVERLPGATCQTSPHLVLPLGPGRRDALTVMPQPPDDDDRRTLAEVLERVNLFASDHVSPPVGAPPGPGLQTQQHFVPALLTMVDGLGLDMRRTWHQVTTAPRQIFGLNGAGGFLVVDPSPQPPVELWPRQQVDRAPYLGSTLRGRVLAVTDGERGVMV